MPDVPMRKRLANIEWPLFNVLSPSVSLAELVYGLVTALAVTNTLSFVIQGEPNENYLLVVAALGANLAWGIADGMIYLLSSTVENRRIYADAQELKEIDDEIAKATILDDLTGTMVHTLDEAEKRKIIDVIHTSLKKSEPRHVTLKKREYYGAVICILLSLLAAIPIIIPHVLIADPMSATLAGNVIGLIMMFILGIVWADNVNEPRLRSGSIMVVMGLIIMIVITIFGG